MKWSAGVLTSALVVSSAFTSTTTQAFTPTTTSIRPPVRVSQRRRTITTAPTQKAFVYTFTRSAAAAVKKTPLLLAAHVSMAMSASYTVGIVGATGAVGKEIRTCLEARDFPVSKLRIFGSSRSAGSVVATEKYGSVTVELFDVTAARQCDVVFLAVSGDFSLEHARALSDGEDGCVVIDNSVRKRQTLEPTNSCTREGLILAGKGMSEMAQWTDVGCNGFIICFAFFVLVVCVKTG